MAKMSMHDRVEAQIKAVTGTQVIALATGDALALVRDGVQLAQALKRGPFWAVSTLDYSQRVPAKLIGLAKTEAIARKALEDLGKKG